MSAVSLLCNVPAACSAFHGRNCPDSCTCCHTDTEAADQTDLTLSGHTDARPPNDSNDPIIVVAWQGNHQSTDFDLILWISVISRVRPTGRPSCVAMKQER